MRWMRSKTPGEKKRYSIDWSSWLDPGEAVQEVVYTIQNNTDDSPLVVSDDAITPSAQGAQYYVAGGLLGEQYEVVVTMTTNQGQIWQGAVFFAIREP